MSRSSLPLSTYRVQLSADFTFDDARELVPYLHNMGISHLYVSPITQAVSGSTHGYNVANPNAINVELGGDKAFYELSDCLLAHDMGLIVDFVPNHLGIASGENPMWQDVMAFGPHSPYIKFFDVNWKSSKKKLRGRALVPLMGDYYGQMLEDGKISLCYDEVKGCFDVIIDGQVYPIRPGTYVDILNYCFNIKEGDFSSDFISLLGDFASLTFASGGEDRRQKSFALQARLAEFLQSNPLLLKKLESGVRKLNGKTGDRESFRSLHELLEKQYYRLGYWRSASNEVNYRRFFQINELAALRMERREVFEHVHRMIFKLIAEGRIQGLRIDHIDGLLKPKTYIKRLREKLASLGKSEKDDFYLIVEKILGNGEELRFDWNVHGTTGYDFLIDNNNLFVDLNKKDEVTKVWHDFVKDGDLGYLEVLHKSLCHVMENEMAAELNNCVDLLEKIAERDWMSRDFSRVNLREAFVEVIAGYSVYRTYISKRKGADREDYRVIRDAVDKARRRNMTIAPALFDFIEEALSGDLAQREDRDYPRALVYDFVRKVQQFAGPVIAKGMEDTAFYRYYRLSSLNEVGGEPDVFGCTVNHFQKRMVRRQLMYPNSMLASSTHDTKRGEDTRARINVVPELIDLWSCKIKKWSELNHSFKTNIDGVLAPFPKDEYLFYQSLLGIWPIKKVDDIDIGELTYRLGEYMVKAAREAKEYTDWSSPNEKYETALHNFVARVINPELSKEFLDDFIPFVSKLAKAGMVNSLAQIVIKNTCPGIPDLYRGTERWDLCLVDPDNRRPLDYKELVDFSNKIDDKINPEAIIKKWENGEVKQFVLHKLLSARKTFSDLFVKGSYQPLTVAYNKPGCENVLAFERYFEGQALVIVVPRLNSRAIFDGKKLSDCFEDGEGMLLPGISSNDELYNLFTGGVIKTSGGKLMLKDLFKDFPVAVLIKG